MPTGVGAAIGGFAGDAGPATRLLAAACDRLITHPNAVNGASLFGLPANALYVEGHALDDWLAGRWALRPRARQRVGLLIDRAVEGHPIGTLEATLNAANATRAVLGIEIIGWELTDTPLGCRVLLDPSGIAYGEVDRADALLGGARKLLDAGATAIAIVADLGILNDADERAYQAGNGVDPIGGLEAILSHLIVSELGVPAAHAPLLPFDAVPPPLVDPRAAAEYLGHTFLPCILLGLSAHPDLVPYERVEPTDILPGSVAALVVPVGCLGGAGVLGAIDRRIPIIAVGENVSVLNVTADALGLGEAVCHASNYLEAAGLITALRAGIDWRTCRRPLLPIARLATKPALKRP